VEVEVTRAASNTGELVTPALSSGLNPDQLRELARHPLEHGLTGPLRQCLPEPSPLPELELVRTKYKPVRALTAYYRTNPPTASRWLAVSWTAGSSATAGRDFESSAVETLEEEASRRHLLAPFTRLAADDGTSVSVLVSPADPKMTQLVRLQDPAYLDDLLHALASPPVPLRRVARISIVRYRPGQRHVLRADLDVGSLVSTAFIKIDRDESGARALRFARVMGPRLAAGCPGASLCTPLGYAAPERASVWAGSPGRMLSRALGTDAQARRLVELLGRALRFIHDSGDVAAVSGGTGDDQPLAAGVGARAEAASTLRACEHIIALVPGAEAQLAAVSGEVLDQLGQLSEEEPQVTLGDAKCENVITDGRNICLLDLDRVGWGDPAMDLAKLLADLRWWSDRTGRNVELLAVSLVAGYGSCDPVRWSRARLLEVNFQLKLTARRAALHEPGWTALVQRGLDGAARLSAEARL
jgi:hypothetical protein